MSDNLRNLANKQYSQLYIKVSEDHYTKPVIFR